MNIYCTRPGCPNRDNDFPGFQYNITPGVQLFCRTCGMPLILTGNKGHYQPLKALGKGGFGATFLAVDLDSFGKRSCVVKRLEIQPRYTPKEVEGIKKAFEREAKALAELHGNHLQIPDLYDYFILKAPEFNSYISQNCNYLVQQYIEGQDLSRELNKQGRFSENQILEILQQILPTLEFIHNQKLIHRDIKPSNIIRRQDNQKFYLIDFGAVKQVTQGVISPEQSLVFRSEGYAPPEQKPGQQVYPSSDLYALAVSCLELFTNQSLQNLRDPYTHEWNWRSKFPGVNQDLANILDKMLQHLPSNRFQSARDVITALNQKNHAQTPNGSSSNNNANKTRIMSQSKPRTLWILVIVLIIIGIVITKIIPRIKIGHIPPITQPSTPALSFKDKTSGIQINYPENWQLQEQVASPITGGTIAQIVPKPASSSPLSPEFLISIEEIPESESLEGYTQFATEQIQQSAPDVKLLKSDRIKLKNREGYQVVYTGQDDAYNFKFKAMQIWVIENKKAYILTYRAEEKLYDQFLQPVEEMMIKSFELP